MNLNCYIIPCEGGLFSPQAFETHKEACIFSEGFVQWGALPAQRLGDYLNAAASNGTYYTVKVAFSFLDDCASEHLVACRDYVLNEWMT